METGRNATKTRNWAAIVYPESATKNWRDLLADTHMKAFISPLHNRDTDKDGNIKKHHYHVIIVSDGPITQKRANEILEPLNGTKSAEYVKSLKGYVRYLAHLDNPEKAQYDPAEIVALNGADLTEMLRPSLSDVYGMIGEVMSFCEENNIEEFSALAIYAMHERYDWFTVIIEKPYLITQFLNSLRHSKRN